MRTQITVTGRLTNDPTMRYTKDGTRLAEFGLAHNHGKRDKVTGAWEETGQTYFTVTCWRGLAEGVGSSLHKGDPVLVSGSMTSREYERKDGVLRNELKLDAHAVGPDLSRSFAAVNRGSRTPPVALQAGGEVRRPELVPEPEQDEEYEGEEEADGSLVEALPGERS